jgi:hypothetical protein
MGIRGTGEMDGSLALADEPLGHSKMNRLVCACASALLLFPASAWAYRPFDSTDAAIADVDVFEIELSPLTYEHGDDGTAWISPSARFNYGFAKNWELVLEGQVNHFSHGPSQVSDAALSLKNVVREGSLQDGSGISLATEGSILLPGIGTDNGAGLEWTGIASQRWDWGTIHFNIAGILSRDQKAGVFLGTILEGPADWTVRPVAEINYEREFGSSEEYSGLLGLIWQLGKETALDIAYRHARIDGRPDEQLRMGIDFTL